MTDLYAAADVAAICTLLRSGGTFDASTLAPIEPTSGYAVGIERLGPGNGAIATADVISDRLRQAHEPYARPGRYIGTWLTRGRYGAARVYIDRVVILPDRESALILARAMGERAIYDFATGESIEVTE